MPVVSEAIARAMLSFIALSPSDAIRGNDPRQRSIYPLPAQVIDAQLAGFQNRGGMIARFVRVVVLGAAILGFICAPALAADTTVPSPDPASFPVATPAASSEPRLP